MSDTIKVNKVVIEKPKFYTAFTSRKKTTLDYSNPNVDIYESIPPYSVDVETGEILNKTAVPILRKTGTKNVDEMIQSYAEDCDIYKILEKFALTNDTSLINQKVGSFGDIVDIPDNINDFTSYVDKQMKDLKKIDPKLAQSVINENISSDDIQKMVQEQVQAALIKAQEDNKQVTTEPTTEVK